MSSRSSACVVRLALILGLLSVSPSFAAEVSELWRWGTDTKEGERVLSHSLTLYRKNNVFDGHAGKRCSISEGREKEIPLEKVEFDPLTRKVSFFIYWDNPENEDGSRRTYDAKYEGVLGDRNFEGTLTYINEDDCLRPVQGNVMLVYLDTGAKSDLVKEIIPPTANVKGRYDIRLLGRPSVNDLNGKKIWVGGRGFAYIGGGGGSFKSFKTPSQIEIEFIGKSYDTFKPCHPITREGARDPKNAIQLIGDGKMVTKATKNPQNPVGVFTIRTLSRCREVPATKKGFN